MRLKNNELETLIKIENKLAKDKKYYDEFCSLCTIIENLIQRRDKTNRENWARISEKRKTNKNYGRKPYIKKKYRQNLEGIEIE